jgi:hypothetical protein
MEESIYFARSCSTPSNRPLSLAGFFNDAHRDEDIVLMDSSSQQNLNVKREPIHQMPDYPVMMMSSPTSPPLSPNQVSSCSSSSRSSSYLNYENQNKFVSQERQGQR